MPALPARSLPFLRNCLTRCAEREQSAGEAAHRRRVYHGTRRSRRGKGGRRTALGAAGRFPVPARTSSGGVPGERSPSDVTHPGGRPRDRAARTRPVLASAGTGGRSAPVGRRVAISLSSRARARREATAGSSWSASRTPRVVFVNPPGRLVAPAGWGTMPADAARGDDRLVGSGGAPWGAAGDCRAARMRFTVFFGCTPANRRDGALR